MSPTLLGMLEMPNVPVPPAPPPREPTPEEIEAAEREGAKLAKAKYEARGKIRRMVTELELLRKEVLADKGAKVRADRLQMKIVNACLSANINPDEVGLSDAVSGHENDDPSGLAAEQKVVELNEDQRGFIMDMERHFNEALLCEACGYALDKPCKKHRVYILAGAGGTGKSTIAGELIRRYSTPEPLGTTTKWLPSLVVMLAPTNKAAQRLLEITGRCAGTYHSVAYERPVIDKGTGELLGFVSREHGTADIHGWALVIMDEASMASEQIRDALLQAVPRSVRFLVVGDPCQLPPVKAAPGFDLEHPNWMLKVVHRQAMDSPLFRAITMVREERLSLDAKAVKRIGCDVMDVEWSDIGRSLAENRIPVLLCRTNETRWRINCAGRTARGYPEMKYGPKKGERVTAYSTNHRLQIANGEMGTVFSCKPGLPVGDHPTWWVVVDWDARGEEPVVVPQASWNPPEKPWDPGYITAPVSQLQQQVDDAKSYRLLALQPAEAMTVHRAQGSQWPGVVIFMENSKGSGGLKTGDGWKLDYTAMSRAQEWVQFIRIRRKGEPPKFRVLPVSEGRPPPKVI